MIIEVCEVLTTPALVEKWPHQNEVIDLCNQKISKITTSRAPHFKPIPTNLIQKGLIFFL
jgi:hypothetical protein